jgi:hypothetical protein
MKSDMHVARFSPEKICRLFLLYLGIVRNPWRCKYLGLGNDGMMHLINILYDITLGGVLERWR